jgi:hypothetical protein
VVQEESNKIYFIFFWTLLQVSTNFGSLNYFLPFKTIEKTIKTASGARAKTARGGGTAACHMRLANKLAGP